MACGPQIQILPFSYTLSSVCTSNALPVLKPHWTSLPQILSIYLLPIHLVISHCGPWSLSRLKPSLRSLSPWLAEFAFTSFSAAPFRPLRCPAPIHRTVTSLLRSQFQGLFLEAASEDLAYKQVYFQPELKALLSPLATSPTQKLPCLLHPCTAVMLLISPMRRAAHSQVHEQNLYLASPSSASLQFTGRM